jgi:uncharacterized SAM-binding protein YcdF (DUF218 family)
MHARSAPGEWNGAHQPALDDMMNGNRRPRTWLWVAVLLAVLVFLGNAGKMLVVDAPESSDLIVVLAGEMDRRPALAIELLNRGYARKVIFDVPAQVKAFGFTEMQLAQKYIQSLPQAGAMSICAIEGLSTRDEARDAEKCLAGEEGRRVLLVTSDFHTRRALSIFRREMPGKVFSVAGARDDTQFGTKWWTHRQWAKTFFDEGLRWVWWKAVDQWR